MKKHTKKLTLNKKTISNLPVAEMSKKVGGTTYYHHCGNHSACLCGGTKNGNTCPGHNTCYNC